MSISRGQEGQPTDFATFMAGRHHRVFAIFDDAPAAEEAIEALRFDDLAKDEDVWVFRGEEDARRLDLVSHSHGVWATGFRILQRMLSSDVGYLRALDDALRDGHTVVAVWTPDERAADELARLLSMYCGYSVAYCVHLDFVPVAA